MADQRDEPEQDAEYRARVRRINKAFEHDKKRARRRSLGHKVGRAALYLVGVLMDNWPP